MKVNNGMNTNKYFYFARGGGMDGRMWRLARLETHICFTISLLGL
jgi:hypothetical protein